MNPQKVAEMKRQLIAFAAKPVMAKAAYKADPRQTAETLAPTPAVVLPYKIKRSMTAKATLKMPRPTRQAIAAAR